MKCNHFWDDTWNCLTAIGYKMKLASKAESGQGSVLSAYKKYLGILADHKFCISLRLLKDIQKNIFRNRNKALLFIPERQYEENILVIPCTKLMALNFRLIDHFLLPLPGRLKEKNPLLRLCIPRKTQSPEASSPAWKSGDAPQPADLPYILLLE